MQEHPLQIMVRCDRASELAAQMFTSNDIVEAQLHDDRHGVFFKTRNADAFYTSLNRLVVERGLNIETVTPVDDDLNAVYHYLIGSNGGGNA
jgi:hypothetical protein